MKHFLFKLLLPAPLLIDGTAAAPPGMTNTYPATDPQAHPFIFPATLDHGKPKLSC